MPVSRACRVVRRWSSCSCRLITSRRVAALRRHTAPRAAPPPSTHCSESEKTRDGEQNAEEQNSEKQWQMHGGQAQRERPQAQRDGWGVAAEAY